SWSCGLERLLAELTQRVVAARQEFARDRKTGAVAAESLSGLVVVAAIRTARTPCGLRGLVERPAQHRRSLAGEVAGAAALVGLVDRDVQPGVAHRLPR